MMKTAQNKPQPPNLEYSIAKGQLAALGLKRHKWVNNVLGFI
jgi:hypothetical protein